MSETSKKIKFSIIIPTYQRSGFLKKTILSFINQVYKNFEIIVVDDGGTDNSKEIANSFHDARIKYFWKENEERGAARNYGAKLAKGTYLNFFDSDDIALENHLSEAVNAIQILNEPMVFHLGMEMKDSHGKVLFSIKHTKNNEKIFKYNYVNPNAVFMHRDAFKEVQYNEDRNLSISEDWLFHLQLASRFTFIPFDDVITSTMLQHDSRSMNKSSSNNIIMRKKLLIKYLLNDKTFMKKSSGHLNKINAEMTSLTALYLALENKNLESLKFLNDAIVKYPIKIFTRRFLAIFKIISTNLFKIVLCR